MLINFNTNRINVELYIHGFFVSENDQGTVSRINYPVSTPCIRQIPNVTISENYYNLQKPYVI